MLGKIAIEECWSFPEMLEVSSPGQYVAAGHGDRLTRELLDIHDSRLKQMDENGVEFMVLSLCSPGPQGLSDPEKAEALATKANDYIEQEVMKNPTRFAAFASVSMHDPAQAAEELTRCMTSKKGFVGVMLNDFQSSGPDSNTMLFYDQPAYDIFWKTCSDLSAPVYLHPRLPTPLIHEQMWKGREWLNFSAIGYANRLNMHILGIITSGVLDRFPALKLLCGHMGEHIPFDIWRIDHKLDRARFPKMPMSPTKLVRDYFGTQMFVTTSGHFSTPALLCTIAEIGARSVLFSIDYPFESIPNGCTWWDEHASTSINGHDLVEMGRNNVLRVLPRLMEAPHGLKIMGAGECEVGGLRGGGVTYGLYNESWGRRMVRR